MPQPRHAGRAEPELPKIGPKPPKSPNATCTFCSSTRVPAALADRAADRHHVAFDVGAVVQLQRASRPPPASEDLPATWARPPTADAVDRAALPASRKLITVFGGASLPAATRLLGEGHVLVTVARAILLQLGRRGLRAGSSAGSTASSEAVASCARAPARGRLAGISCSSCSFASAGLVGAAERPAP